MISARIAHEYRNAKYKVAIHDDEMPDRRAEFAMQLMGNLSISAAAPDGVDDAGRQALRLMKPGEVAERACDIAEEAFGQFHARGWMVQLPSAEEYFAANGVTDAPIVDEDD